jgi:hypothetical protein
MKATFAKPEDAKQPATSKTSITVEPPVELARGEKTRAWQVYFTVAGLERNASEPRVMTLRLGTLNVNVPYSVNNLPSEEFKWTVTPPVNPWVVYGEKGRQVKILIATTAQAVSGVTVSHQLVEATNKRPLPPDALELCSQSNECGPAVRADAHRAVSAYLRVRRDLDPGKYAGPVYLTTPEKPGPESVAVNLHISSPGHHFWGVVVLILGVVLGFVATAWSAARLARLAAARVGGSGPGGL